MGAQTSEQRRGALWKLIASQHGVVTRAQLLRLGFTAKAIDHRVRTGRLHAVHRGVFAVGRPELSTHGGWMAAVLRCGRGAALSHKDAAALWGVRPPGRGPIEVSVPAPVDRRPPGIRVHQRTDLVDHVVEHEGVPVTSIGMTLVDLALVLPRNQLERAVSEADRLDLIDPDSLRSFLDGRRTRGVAALRRTLDRRTFRLTDSELERRFLILVRRAGLPLPETGARVAGLRVDFHWPDIGLVVETDGLRYHRTPSQQARDRRRDQALARAGLACLRFTHAQVRYEAAQVIATLAAVASAPPRFSGVDPPIGA